jgi:hypothetical protein
MTDRDHGRHIEVEEDGRVVGSADVQPAGDTTIRAALYVEAGHLPVDAGAKLVDAVLDLPEMHEGSRLEATLPLGETESLRRLRDRCDDVHTHPAGATCLVDATLPGEDETTH